MRVVELNNVDVFGKSFNGYCLAEKNYKKTTDKTTIEMLVNHKLGKAPFVHGIYDSFGILRWLLEEVDDRVESVEAKYSIKNQVSLTEEALVRNKYYKKADVLHFHMYHNMHLPIEFLTRIKDKKIIIDLHDTFWLTNDSNISMLEVFDYCNANASSLTAQRKRVLNDIGATFVIHSDYMARKIKESGILKSEKIKTIPFGVDLNIFHPDNERARLRKEKGIKDDEFVILCRSQKEFKGIDYIEKALRALKIDKKITVITVQEKGLLDSLKSKYKIIELGRIGSSKKMARIYNMADLFVMPSTEESFGMMAIEAMACGLPVIVFEGTALPDTVDAPNVGIATKRDYKKLASAIENIIKNPDEAKMRGRKGIDFVKRKYDIADYYSNMLNLYESVYQEKVEKTKVPQENDGLVLPKNSKALLKDMYRELLGRRSRTAVDSATKIDYNDAAVQEFLSLNSKKAYRSIRIEAFFRNILWGIRRIKSLFVSSDRQ